MGNMNASRPDNLPPSQGGRYQGFGSTGAGSPSIGMTSASAPSLNEFQENPVAALSKVDSPEILQDVAS
jgi:ADP-ribosylation factor GTPase-activating protein 1